MSDAARLKPGGRYLGEKVVGVLSPKGSQSGKRGRRERKRLGEWLEGLLEEKGEGNQDGTRRRGRACGGEEEAEAAAAD